MPRRLIARLVGTGLRAVGGALSGAGSIVLRFAAEPGSRSTPTSPGATGADSTPRH